MADTKVYPDKHLTYWFVPAGGISNIKAPTAIQINSGVNLSEAIAWDGTDVNPSESSDLDDAAITDAATAVEPGFDQFGVALQFFYPKDMSLSTDPQVIAYETFAPGRVEGFVVRRFKPEDTNTATYMNSADEEDWVEVFKVMADYTEHDTEGEDSTKFTVNFLPQGDMSGPVLIKSSNSVVVTPASPTMTAGDVQAIVAKLDGYNITADATWSTSNSAVATVSSTGVITAHSDGTATITANYPSADSPGTVSVTVGS